jgi:uncharacterized protein YkwD
MKIKLFSIPRFLIFTFFALSVFSGIAHAQRIEPDKQILREMLAYVGRVESSASAARLPNPPKTKSIETSDLKRPAREKESRTATTSATSALERKAFDILNEQRAARGLAPLRWNEDMARVARLHSENMARYKFFSHQGRDGSQVSTRANAIARRTWYSIGENIAFNNGFRKPVEMACQQWMTSPGHRQNILDNRWTESGIGAAFAPDGSFYITQVFIN